MSIAIKSARARAQARFAPRGGPGDPGVFSWIGKVAKKAVSFIPGVGPIASELMGAVGIGRDRPRPVAQPVLSLPAAQYRPAAVPRPGQIEVTRPEAGIVPRIERFVPGGETGMETVSVACPKGYHPNKAGYWLKSGAYVEKGTRCVKNRRKNPMNARALSSAISRVDGGKRFQHTLSEIETKKFTKAGNRKACPHK